MKDFRVNLRKLAKPDMFVWIPAGFKNGEPDGMTGYWDGTLREDSGGTERAEVEFIVNDGFAKVLVNKYQIYAATDDDIEKELVENETQSWRDFQLETPLKNAAKWKAIHPPLERRTDFSLDWLKI